MRLRGWAQRLRRDTLALWIAARSPETPLAARLIALLVTAYAFSPIDLIPDFIPVLGLLDDLLLVPLGLALAIRLIPPPLMDRFRDEADKLAQQPTSKIVAAVIILFWLALMGWLGWELTAID